MTKAKQHTSSYKDPDGFIFTKDNTVYRQVNRSYTKTYDKLISSGLYQKLIHKKLLVPHKPAKVKRLTKNGAFVIKPLQIPHISYPYEWCFTALKDAALLTLTIQKYALDHNMILKDASAYNVQIYKGKPVFIDTLSFATYKKNTGWIGYRQFCRHFLAPLALMIFCDVNLSLLLRTHLDGIPLQLCSNLLPLRTWLNPKLCIHLHMHAKAQTRLSKHRPDKAAKLTYSKKSHYALIESLINTTTSLQLKYPKTQWGNYRKLTSYSKPALSAKRSIIEHYLQMIKSNILWDIGANTGDFSIVASQYCKQVVSFDMDPVAIDKLYNKIHRQQHTQILPLIIDLTNPSPNLGWSNRERVAFINRSKPDTIMALALIHHLIMSHNISFSQSALFFSQHCRYLIIEFVPKNDPQAMSLTTHRHDMFRHYTKRNFEQKYAKHFTLIERKKITHSKRTLYLYKHK